MFPLERPSSQNFRGRRSNPFISAPDHDQGLSTSVQGGPDDESEWYLVHKEIDSLEEEFQAKKQALYDELSALANLAESTANRTAHADAYTDRQINESHQEAKSVPGIGSIGQRERRQKLQSELESSTRELMAGVNQLQHLGQTAMSLLEQLKSLDSSTIDAV